jgi:hypothetical protein
VLILAAIYVVVASLFFPEGVQFLNPVVCPADTELSNGAYALPGGPNDAKLELVCTSPTYTASVGPKVLMVAAGLLAAGVAVQYLSRWILLRYPQRSATSGAPMR